MGNDLLLAIFFYFVRVFMDYPGDIKRHLIRCPKCGAFYSSKQGAETFEWMRGELKDTRGSPGLWLPDALFLIQYPRSQNPKEAWGRKFPLSFYHEYPYEKDAVNIHLIAQNFFPIQ